MTDIVQRLRTPRNWNDELHREAADEIERLRQWNAWFAAHNTELKTQNAELLAVLNKIADLRLTPSSAASIAQSALDTIRMLKS